MHHTYMYKQKAEYRKVIREENAEWEKLAQLFNVVIATPTAIDEPEYDIASFKGLNHYINNSFDLCNNEAVSAFMFFPKVRNTHPSQPKFPYTDERAYPKLWGTYYRNEVLYHRNRLTPIKNFVATIIASKEN